MSQSGANTYHLEPAEVVFQQTASLGKTELIPGTIIHDELTDFGASKHDRIRARQNAIRQMVKEQLFLQAQNPGLRHLGNNRKKLSAEERKRIRKAQKAGRRNARKGA